MGKRTLTLLVLGIFLFVVAVPALRLASFAYGPFRAGALEQAFVQIHKGQGPTEVAKVLAGVGAIDDIGRFVQLVRYTRKWKAIKAGEYKVSAAMSPMELFDVLTSGVSAAHPLTVREGENM